MGRPPKYKNSAERTAARRAQIAANVRAFRLRRRGVAGSVVSDFSEEAKKEPEADEGEVDSTLLVTCTDSSLMERSTAPDPSDFSAHSNHALIDLSFGALSQVVWDMHYAFGDKRVPKFPWFKIISKIDWPTGVDGGPKLMELSAFSTAALRVGMRRNDPGLLKLGAEGKQLMLRSLREGIGVVHERQNRHHTSKIPDRLVSLFATNEAILMMGLFEHAVAMFREQDLGQNTAFNYLERTGFAMVQAAGPLAFQNDLGWWIMRYIFLRITWTSMIDRKACFLEDAAWIATLSRCTSDSSVTPGSTPRGDYVPALWKLCARVPRLMEMTDVLASQSCSIMRQSSADSLVQDIMDIIIQFQHFWSFCRESFADQPWSELPPPSWLIGENDTEISHVFPKSLWFTDRRTADICIIYWTYNIATIALVEQLRPFLPDDCAIELLHTLKPMDLNGMPTLAFTENLKSPQFPILDAGAQYARYLCSTLQYMTESLDVDPGLDVSYSDTPTAATYIAESFFRLWSDRYAAELQ